MTKIVCDAEFLIFLAKISLFEKFLELYEEIYITNVVKNEVLVENKPGFFRLQRAINENKIKIRCVPENKYNSLVIFENIDEGEASSIILAKEINALFFSDDKRARNVAKNFHLKVKGILGLILDLYKNGSISREEALSYLDKLVQDGFWINDNLYKKIRNEILNN